jgi:hypothetical protein
VNLSPRALQVLIDLKSELLSRETQPEVAETPCHVAGEEVVSEEPKEKEEKPTQFMRHARLHGESWQKYHRRGGW